jgi:putative glutamine amidotransferase
MQALNVFFGGTLHTCIPGHQQAQGDLIHPTRARGLLSQLLGPAPLVNSNHHQAVRVLGEELCLLQQAADGTIEGFCHETLPILGVQWHPERQSGARLREDAVDAGPLLRYFVGQCSCKSAPGLVHCEKRGEADESHHTGTKSGAGTAYGG